MRFGELLSLIPLIKKECESSVHLEDIELWVHIKLIKYWLKLINVLKY